MVRFHGEGIMVLEYFNSLRPWLETVRRSPEVIDPEVVDEEEFNIASLTDDDMINCHVVLLVASGFF